MADKVKIWFDAEADYLEVRFSDAAGYEKETWQARRRYVLPPLQHGDRLRAHARRDDL